MTAIEIFPLEPWLPNTNQNSTSANDNSLALEAHSGPALGILDAAPAGTPADHDQYLVSTGFSGHLAGNIIVYLGGTWKEFTGIDGMVKSADGVQFVRIGGVWTPTPIWSTTPETSSSPGVKGQIAYDSSNFYVCVNNNDWGQVALSSF